MVGAATDASQIEYVRGLNLSTSIGSFGSAI